MGSLRSRNQGVIPLPCRCLIGRSPLAHVRLSSDFASSEHAVVYWQGGTWKIRDLSSRNRTFVNDVSLDAGIPRVLSLGDTLRFGSPSEEWVLCDETEPEPYAITADRSREQQGRGGLLLLPDEQEPQISIYFDGSKWICEDASCARPVATGESLVLPSGTWSLLLPELRDGSILATKDAQLTLGQVVLDLAVSSDEERVYLALDCDGVSRPLPSRACLYTLLTLARERAVASKDSAEAGWVDAEELSRSLGCSREKLNVDIHRLRRLFLDAGVSDGERIVERHADTCQLRIGTSRLRLKRLADS